MNPRSSGHPLTGLTRAAYPADVPHSHLADNTEPTPRDVFAFCNHLAWEIGGPVLIHDSNWGVVAYSTLNQPIDDARRSIILRREVPDVDAEVHIITLAEGIFETGDDLFETPAVPGVQARRLVAPVRVLGVRVGSIWVAESAGPLNPDAQTLLLAAAKQASFYFQVQADWRAREHEVFVRMLLAGSTEEAFLAQYLGVTTTSQFTVMSVWHGSDDDLRGQAPRVTKALADRHGLPHLLLAEAESFYLIGYEQPGLDEFAQRAKRTAQDLSITDDRLIVGVGRVALRPLQVAQSRADADAVVAYLRRNPHRRVANHSSLRAGVGLMRVVEILERQSDATMGYLNALSSLTDDDRREGIDTLNAYFDYGGNAAEAARHLHIHPNTFRYRLAKVTDLIGVDLADRDERLMLELDLLRDRYAQPPA